MNDDGGACSFCEAGGIDTKSGIGGTRSNTGVWNTSGVLVALQPPCDAWKSYTDSPVAFGLMVGVRRVL